MSCSRTKRIVLVLPLLLLLVFFLVGCKGSATSGAGTGSTQSTTGTSSTQSTTTQSQTPSSTDSKTNVNNGDQQVQDLLKSLDNAQQDANNADNTGDQQDTNPQP